MEKRFLLGVIGNQIILGEFEVRDWNGYDEFTASFDVGEAFNVDLDEQEIRDYWEEYWYCADATTRLYCLDDGEITKEEWLQNCIDDSYYTEIKDCSCTDLEMDYKDITINFETVSCGQHDVREDYGFDKMIFTNKEAFDKLMELWDTYHLKEVDDSVKNEVAKIEELLAPYNWYDGDKVEDFIRENLEY